MILILEELVQASPLGINSQVTILPMHCRALLFMGCTVDMKGVTGAPARIHKRLGAGLEEAML